MRVCVRNQEQSLAQHLMTTHLGKHAFFEKPRFGRAGFTIVQYASVYAVASRSCLRKLLYSICHRVRGIGLIGRSYAGKVEYSTAGFLEKVLFSVYVFIRLRIRVLTDILQNKDFLIAEQVALIESSKGAARLLGLG